jgi:hypothetical protein
MTNNNHDRPDPKSDELPIAPQSSADDMVDDEDPDVSFGRRWQLEFELRSKDALAGLHQPMLHELILHMPPLHDSLDADAQIWAERLIARLQQDGAGESSLIKNLQALLVAPTRDSCSAAAEALEAAWKDPSLGAAYLAEGAGRCDYYAAAKNSRAAAFRLAGRALAHALNDGLPRSVQLTLIEAALGWLTRAAWDLPDIIELYGPEQGGPAVRRSAELGHEVMSRVTDLLEDT